MLILCSPTARSQPAWGFGGGVAASDVPGLTPTPWDPEGETGNGGSGSGT